MKQEQKSFRQRLQEAAREAREKAASLPAGKGRDDLMKKARDSETALKIDIWISSSGLRPPTELSSIIGKPPPAKA